MTSSEIIRNWIENLFYGLFPEAIDTRASRHIAKAELFMSKVQFNCCRELCVHIDTISAMSDTAAVIEIARVLLAARPGLVTQGPRAIIATIIFKIGLKEFCQCDNLQPKDQDYPF